MDDIRHFITSRIARDAFYPGFYPRRHPVLLDMSTSFHMFIMHYAFGSQERCESPRNFSIRGSCFAILGPIRFITEFGFQVSSIHSSVGRCAGGDRLNSTRIQEQVIQTISSESAPFKGGFEERVRDGGCKYLGSLDWPAWE
jgi:hypothetical protein